MNITGGIANVLTGSSNIFMERAAGEYINLKDWEAGKSEWIKGTVSYMANMYSEIVVHFKMLLLNLVM